MSFIDGQLGTIDLKDMHPSDFFKIGVSHGEQGWTQEPTYISQPAYLEGYAFGLSMKPYVNPRNSEFRDIPVPVQPPSQVAIPQFPVFSRGLPFTSSQGAQFGGPNAESNAIDSDYGTTWNSVFTPNDGSAEWYVLDLRGVAAGTKTNVWMIWKNGTGNYYEPTATLGQDPASVFANLPRNYKLQGHTSSGSQPAVGDVGWTDLVSVTDNRYNQKIHTGLNLSTYNWFRFYCTAASGIAGVNDSVSLEFDLRDASGGTADTLFWYGDSIAWEGFNIRRPGNAVWNNGPLENVVQTATSRVAPVSIDGAKGGWTSNDGDINKVTYIGGTPCKYVMLCFGTNDANLANIDLNTLNPSGVNSVYAQSFKTQYQSMIDYVFSLGKISIIPHIPWGNLNTWTIANLIILNTIIDQLVAANPTKVLAGPDLYSFFNTNQNLIRDHVHPTYDQSNGAGLLNGLVGYENMLILWRDRLISLLYTTS